MQSTSMLSQKRCNLFTINETSWIIAYLASSQIMLDTDESFAFEDDEVIMDEFRLGKW
jgi:hypothetical protein